MDYKTLARLILLEALTVGTLGSGVYFCDTISGRLGENNAIT